MITIYFIFCDVYYRMLCCTEFIGLLYAGYWCGKEARTIWIRVLLLLLLFFFFRVESRFMLIAMWIIESCVEWPFLTWSKFIYLCLNFKNNLKILLFKHFFSDYVLKPMLLILKIPNTIKFFMKWYFQKHEEIQWQGRIDKGYVSNLSSMIHLMNTW
jgi:hypothetical protein